jgi:outer membrane protein assembly factor BamB
MIRNIWLLYALAFTAGAVLAVGCGSGNRSDAGGPGAPTGSASVTITWPSPSRLVPAAANSIRIAFTNGSTPVAEQVVARPASGDSSTVTFNGLPVGDLTATATAYPSSDGSGVVQATGTTPVTIATNETTLFHITMGSTVDRIEVAPANASVGVGNTVGLTATAKSAAGEVVLVAANKLTWASSSTGIATVSPPTGTTTSVTGVAAGSATVTVTDAESTKAATATVTVRPVGLAQSPWPKFRGNARNTGRVGSGSAAAGTLRWSYTTGGSVQSSPAIGADGTVYVGSDDGKLYALDGATGVLKWSYTTGDGVSSSPAVGPDGTVYVGSGDGKVYALDGASGARKCSYSTSALVHSSPAIGADGTVYVGSHDWDVYALDAATGVKKWSYTTYQLV